MDFVIVVNEIIRSVLWCPKSGDFMEEAVARRLTSPVGIFRTLEVKPPDLEVQQRPDVFSTLFRPWLGNNLLKVGI